MLCGYGKLPQGTNPRSSWHKLFPQGKWIFRGSQGLVDSHGEKMDSLTSQNKNLRESKMKGPLILGVELLKMHMGKWFPQNDTYPRSIFLYNDVSLGKHFSLLWENNSQLPQKDTSKFLRKKHFLASWEICFQVSLGIHFPEKMPPRENAFPKRTWITITIFTPVIGAFNVHELIFLLLFSRSRLVFLNSVISRTFAEHGSNILSRKFHQTP